MAPRLQRDFTDGSLSLIPSFPDPYFKKVCMVHWQPSILTWHRFTPKGHHSSF